MRLVLDTNTVVSALLWDGIPGRLLDAARERDIELFTSAPLLAELEEVLSRRKFKSKIAASPFCREALIPRYAAMSALVIPESTLRIVSDPDDDIAIGTARSAQADAVVSGDDHLLRLKSVDGILMLSAASAFERLRFKRKPVQ